MNIETETPKKIPYKDLCDLIFKKCPDLPKQILYHCYVAVRISFEQISTWCYMQKDLWCKICDLVSVCNSEC